MLQSHQQKKSEIESCWFTQSSQMTGSNFINPNNNVGSNFIQPFGQQQNQKNTSSDFIKPFCNRFTQPKPPTAKKGQLKVTSNPFETDFFDSTRSKSDLKGKQSSSNLNYPKEPESESINYSNPFADPNLVLDRSKNSDSDGSSRTDNTLTLNFSESYNSNPFSSKVGQGTG